VKKISECNECGVPFHTAYGLRVHRVRVHGASIKTLKSKRKRKR